MKIAIFTDTFDPDINGVARTLKRFTDYLGEQDISFKVFAPMSIVMIMFRAIFIVLKVFPFFYIQSAD